MHAFFSVVFVLRRSGPLQHLVDVQGCMIMMYLIFKQSTNEINQTRNSKAINLISYIFTSNQIFMENVPLALKNGQIVPQILVN